MAHPLRLCWEEDTFKYAIYTKYLQHAVADPGRIIGFFIEKNEIRNWHTHQG